jgi:hypothetical protein
MLQAYGSKKALEKAEEAEQKAKEADLEGFEQLRRELGPQQQVMGPDMFADPMQMDSKYTPPQMQTVTPTQEEREDRLMRAMAMGSPAAQKYAQLMLEQTKKGTEGEEYYAPVLGEGGKYVQFGKRGNVLKSDIVGPQATKAERDERIVPIMGADGKPTYVRESQAVGQSPFTPRTLAQETADAAAAQARSQREIDTQSALDNIGELIAHPGRQAATGKSSFVRVVPGTDAYDFNAKLDTFKAQTFIPMVSALKGMGALSDAEGKRLQAAVGALDPSMSEEAFVKELEKVAGTLTAKAKAAGLNVTMPANMGGVIDLPPRRR